MPLRMSDIYMHLGMEYEDVERYGETIKELVANVPMIPGGPDGDLKCIMLSGVPGTGKTTLAKMLVQRLAGRWIIINQEELQSRVECINQCRLALSQGVGVIIDRCNQNVWQRSHWIRLSVEAGYHDIMAVFLNTDKDVGPMDMYAGKRQGEQESQKMDFSRPVPEEGIRYLYTVNVMPNSAHVDSIAEIVSSINGNGYHLPVQSKLF